MGRAERRRLEKEKRTPQKTYYLTDVEIRQIKEEAAQEAVNTAMTLMFIIPLRVLMQYYWPKASEKKLHGFIDRVLTMYNRWIDGKEDMDKMKEDLWNYGGVRLEERRE